MEPPPPAPNRINFTEVQPGSFVVGDGGGKPANQGIANVQLVARGECCSLSMVWKLLH
jgi:hypothetical protein